MIKVFVKGGTSCMNRKGDLYRYKNYLIACGHQVVSKEEDAEIILLWGCSFRNDYRENSYDILSKTKARTNAEVILCGCLPSIDAEGVAQRFNGRYFAWKEQEQALAEIFGTKTGCSLDAVDRTFVEIAIGDIEKYKSTHADSKIVFHDQFMKLFISEGCSLKCSFCSDRLAFPQYKSFPLDKLLRETEKIYRLTGSNKVLFCGDSIGDYGCDTGSTLVELIESVLAIDDTIQVGFNNFNPLHFMKYQDQLLKFFRKSKICFIDLPIQSASDCILLLMNRLYKVEDIDSIFFEINKTGFKELETDVLIGFSSETDADFQKTVEFLLKHKPKYVQISAYMDTLGARSSTLNNKIPENVIQERMGIIKEKFKSNNILYDSVGSNVLKDWPDLCIEKG